ncbi:MAG: hypothetical protein RLY35_1312 [Bacteroidota bacterium]
MNKNIVIVLSFLLLTTSVFAQRKKAIQRGYTTTETVIQDIKNPENSRRTVEVSDKKGRLIHVQEFNNLGKRTKDIATQYGRLDKSIITKNALDSIIVVEHFSYNKQKQLINHETIRKGGAQKERLQIEYNKWGQKIKETVSKNEKVVKTRNFIYNKEGLLLEQNTIGSDGQMQYQKKMNYLHE